MESVLPGYAGWDLCGRCQRILGRCKAGGAGPQAHHRPRAGSAEGRDWLDFNEKEGFGELVYAILAREGALCHSLQGWMRGWLWKEKGLGREGRIVIDVSGDSRAGMRGMRTATVLRLMRTNVCPTRLFGQNSISVWTNQEYNSRD
jgi:hypothetical protein